ncbi:MAG: c-type cytochrome [Verrucomicrobia bacterium]|jgi:cbb3-type cytochrome c oxidase subunit III|nr:c-type cytochrome [Verrucomicrobiota bacterium]
MRSLYTLGLILISSTLSLAQNELTNLESGGITESGKEGKILFGIHCATCHGTEGAGLVGVAPSIRNLDFLALASDSFISQTISKGRPGTAMVARPDLTEEQISSIIAYLRSLPEVHPTRITVDDSLKFSGDEENGNQLFTQFCSACHGPYGEGYMLGLPGTGIGLPGFLEVASDDYIYQTLKRGRLGTPMQPFLGAKGLANLSDKEAHDIITYMRNLGETYDDRMASAPVGPGNSKAGEVHFNINCAACHQSGGKGLVGLAPSIRNPDFLAIASDDFIRQTINQGRAGTGMMARPDLQPQVVNDIIAYLRDAASETNIVHVDATKEFHGDAAAGSDKFARFCSSCHGPNGEGYAANMPGPGIGLASFLEVASDDYIYQTLKKGRIGTPMRAFLGASGLANLTDGDASDIISHLRTLGEITAAPAESATSAFE